MSLPTQAIVAGLQDHPHTGVAYTYGTAGFRTVADVLDTVLYRVGLLAVLRSRKLAGKTIGVMVTASHNPEKDNGVKLVDPLGEMLVASWEGHATKLANARSPDDLVKALEAIVAEESIDLSTPAVVVYGHDTRPSCPALVKAFEDGVDAATVNGDVEKVAAGLVTTPQLHYLVRTRNTIGTKDAYGEPTLNGYHDKLAKAFNKLNAGKQALPPLTVDCANGVGASSLSTFITHLGSSSPLQVKPVCTATNTEGALNHSCGADYVKTQQRAPPALGQLKPGARHASYDGDADRIVYYYAKENGTFALLDGDKIAGLAAGFVIDLVRQAGLDDKGLQVGVVQTAYANGSSTRYLEDVLKLPVACVATGVKHLHHAALSFDCGVYFEANGHGTVLFSPKFESILTSHSPEPNTAAASAHTSLVALVDVINQTVGDALSDMLLVESILLHRSWGPAEWDEAYQDLPNRLVKVVVQDRKVFETKDAERILISPEGIQDEVNKLVKEVNKGRSFVRPSGTEDCVRVYAEAETRKEADELAFKVSGLVFSRCGSGNAPSDFILPA